MKNEAAIRRAAGSVVDEIMGRPVLMRVTMTGADDWTVPEDMIALSREYPFVEWGILVSEKHQGIVDRFPSLKWIDRFTKVATERFMPINISVHFCGRYVRRILSGFMTPLPTEIAALLTIAKRVQLNTHAQPQAWATTLIRALFARPELRHLDVICQLDGFHGVKILNELIETDERMAQRFYPFYDESGGAGALPAKWPRAEYMDAPGKFCMHGYGGGLGPDNLAEQLPRIAEAARGTFWIDMETHVRTSDIFDLTKVRRCLEIAAEWMEHAG